MSPKNVVVAGRVSEDCEEDGGGDGGCAAAPAAQAPREFRVGDRAPDFALNDQNRQETRLSQFRGRTVQVAFYVAAFSTG